MRQTLLLLALAVSAGLLPACSAPNSTPTTASSPADLSIEAHRSSKPTPTPTTSTPSAAYDVTLIYRGVSNSTEWYFQGAIGGSTTCNNTSFVPGDFTNAPTVVNGPLTAGDLVGIKATLYDWQNKVLPSGSCPDHMTGMTSVTDLTHAPSSTATSAPTATATAKPTASPIPTTAPANTTASAANYTQIANGQPWPASFRPYSSLAWNTQLPATPTNIDTSSTSALKPYLTDTVDHIPGQKENDYFHPVYLATTSDPLVHINCAGMQYGCTPSTLPDIRVPAKARPAYGTDAHFSVIQPDGTEYDFWGAKEPSGDWATGSTLNASIGSQTSILGSGVVTPSATSGAALAAGLVRFDELNRGVIPHAVFMNIPCASSTVVYPGTTQAYNCASGGIPVGSMIQLNLTDAQIDALPATTISPFLRPVLHALHQYGGYVEDTYGGSQGYPVWEYESLTQYAAFGATYPGLTFAQQHGYTSYVNPDYLEYQGGVIRWSQLAPYMQVLSSCYSKGSC